MKRLAALILIVFSTLALGQTSDTGSIVGVIYDSSRALIPGVTVSLQGTDGKTISIVSDRQGAFAIPNLRTGNYALTASLRGFADFVGKVEVSAGAAVHQDITLQIAPPRSNPPRSQGGQ